MFCRYSVDKPASTNANMEKTRAAKSQAILMELSSCSVILRSLF